MEEFTQMGMDAVIKEARRRFTSANPDIEF